MLIKERVSSNMYMMDLTALQFKEIKKSVETVLLPIGMMETHGPHCSLGTDVWIPREFVRRLEQEIGDRVLMAPEVAYGHSWALAPFEGALIFLLKPFPNMSTRLVKSFIEMDWSRLFFLMGTVVTSLA